MIDVISTADLFDRIRMEKMWPPGNALCAIQAALLPKRAVPPELLTLLVDHGLTDDDWLAKGDGPCLVLGDGMMGGSGQYYPRPSYAVDEVVAVTRRFRAPQKKAEQDAIIKDQRRRGVESQSIEKNEHWRKAVREQQELEDRKAREARESHPLNQAKRIAALETKIAALETRLAALETNLGVTA